MQSSIRPGDIIRLRAGQRWRETLRLDSAPAQQITIEPYGTGERPLISGSNQIIDWQSQSVSGTDVFTAYCAPVPVAPNQVFLDRERLSHNDGLNTLTPGSFIYVSNSNTLCVRLADTSPPAQHVIEASLRDYGIHVRNARDVTISGLAVTHANRHGVMLEEGVSDIMLSNLSITNNYLFGVDSWSTAPENLRVTIQDSEVAFNSGNGIHFSDRSAHWKILRNSVHQNAIHPPRDNLHLHTAGIKGNAPSSHDILIDGNSVFNNGILGADSDIGAGIWLDTVGAGCVVQNNRVHENSFHGIFVEVTSDTLVFNNVSHNNGGHAAWALGIGVSGRSFPERANGNRIYHNVVWNDKPWSNVYGLAVYGDGGPGNITNTIVRNNIVVGFPHNLRAFRGGENDGVMGHGNVYDHNSLGPEKPNFIEWGLGNMVSGYATWQAAYGQPTYSVLSDPFVVDAARGYFALHPSSPCRSVGLAIDGITASTDVGLSNNQLVPPTRTTGVMMSVRPSSR